MHKIAFCFLLISLLFACDNTNSKTNTSPEKTAAPQVPVKTKLDPREEGATGITTMDPDADGFSLINIHPETAFDLIMSRTVQLIDVRTYDELQTDARIPGARNFDINLDNFKTNLTKLDKNRAHLVYCRSGVRSARACKIMHEEGFKQVYNLEGGYNEYKRLGLYDLR